MDYAAEYRRLHANGKKFCGYTMLRSLDEISELILQTRPRNILDFGSGKGYQYLVSRAHESWGGLLPVCYDPGVPALSAMPEEDFDFVLCTDVMEHIEEADVPGVLLRIFDKCRIGATVFFRISTRPARSKRLSDGRNVHVTVREDGWWREIIAKYQPPSVTVVSVYECENV